MELVAGEAEVDRFVIEAYAGDRTRIINYCCQVDDLVAANRINLHPAGSVLLTYGIVSSTQTT